MEYKDLIPLVPGDLIEIASLMPALDPAPVVLLRVEDKPTDRACIPFVATWKGITLGRWRAAAHGPKLDQIEWRTKSDA